MIEQFFFHIVDDNSPQATIEVTDGKIWSFLNARNNKFRGYFPDKICQLSLLSFY